MARTIRTMGRRGSSSSSSSSSSHSQSDGSDSDGDEGSDAGTNCAVRNGMVSNNYGRKPAAVPTSTVAAAAASSATSARRTVDPAPGRNADYSRASTAVSRMPSPPRPMQEYNNSQLSANPDQHGWSVSRGRADYPPPGRTGADYLRASTTVARMPSPPRQEYNSHRPENRNQHGWNGSRGSRRDFDSSGHHGRPRYDGNRDGAEWHRPHEYFDRGSDRNRDNGRDNDSSWGRDRGSWNGNYDRPHHRKDHYDSRPRGYHGRNNSSGWRDSRPHYSGPHTQRKRQKYGHRNNHRNRTFSNNTWHRQGASRQQDQRDNEEKISALQTNVARLQRELDEMKEKQQHTAAPESLSDSRARAVDRVGAQNPDGNRSDDARVANSSTDASANRGAHSTGGSATLNTAVVVSQSRDVQQHAAPQITLDRANDSTNPPNTEQQVHTHADATSGAPDDKDTSCFDVSTDEDQAGFQPPSADAETFTNNDGNEHESEGEGASDEAQGTSLAAVNSQANNSSASDGHEASMHQFAPNTYAEQTTNDYENEDEDESIGAQIETGAVVNIQANNTTAASDGANEDDRNASTHQSAPNADVRNENDSEGQVEGNATGGTPGAVTNSQTSNTTASNVDARNATTHQSTPVSTSGDESDDEDSADFVLAEDYGCGGTLSFCCLNCECLESPNENRKKNFLVRNNCGNSGGGIGGGNRTLYHKGCCHGDTKQTDDYLSPMTKAMNESLDRKPKKKHARSSSETKSAVQRAYKTASREEARYENEEHDVDKISQNLTNPAYQNYCVLFQQRNRDRRTPLRVLDLFSGIGCGLVALKRLLLPIHKVVHVEHDPVAVEVCKFNHKDDGIIHHYIEKFEEIYGADDEPDEELLAKFVREDGPFDLVLSGAPCQSYSYMNACRDQTSQNAQYLKKVGRLIQMLDRIQGLMGVQDKVLFLSENVIFKDHEDVDKCYGNLSPIRLDAQDFGPVKRNRFYWMNMPVGNSEQIKEVAANVSVDEVLDDGYGAIARLTNTDSNLVVKANAFLASLARIDDSRMSKYKKTENNASSNSGAKFTIEKYSIGERERMMGLPAGYVEKPLQKLFTSLRDKAFLLPETNEEGKNYRDFLPRHYWHYRHKCQFKFQPNPKPPFFQLALSSPLEGKSQVTFFTEEQYGKHLIGNGWSIPVAQYMLAKLPDLFADDMPKTYDEYSYKFPWEPYLSM